LLFSFGGIAVLTILTVQQMDRLGLAAETILAAIDRAWPDIYRKPS